MNGSEIIEQETFIFKGEENGKVTIEFLEKFLSTSCEDLFNNRKNFLSLFVLYFVFQNFSDHESMSLYQQYILRIMYFNNVLD